MATSDLETVHRVIPDGGMNLLLEWTQRGFQCRLVGCLTGPLMKQYRVPTDVLAVRFRPGGVGELFPGPACDYTGRVWNAFTFWEPTVRLAAIVNRARTVDQAVQALTEFVSIETERLQDRPGSLGHQVVRRIVVDPIDFDMRQLSSDFGRSRQQITRAVQATCGLSPKRLARVLRLQRLIGAALHRQADWASLAAECGFYDQAHLIHDCNEFAGTSPAKLIAERNGES